MTKISLLAVVLLVISSHANAGEIFGFITRDEKAIGKETAVYLECPNSKKDSARTDEHGYYRLFVLGEENCEVKLKYGEEMLSFRVSLYKEPVGYDLVVDKAEPGNAPGKAGYYLRRK